jgi:hypothetical protein
VEEEVVEENKEVGAGKAEEEELGQEAEILLEEVEEEILNGDVTIAIVINILSATVKLTRKKEENCGVVTV